MARAYHHVGKDPAVLEAVMQDGFLRPPRQWAHPEDLEKACAGMIEDLARKGADEATVKVLRDLVAGEAAQLRGMGPKGRRGGLYCLDFLLGDVNGVFFSVDRWPAHLMGKERPNGFVFDAEALVRAGARVRDHDFLTAYSGILSDLVLREGFVSPAQARRRMRERTDELRRAYEKAGDEAIATLRSPGEYAEIVADGPVAVVGAMETWKEGERLR